MTLRRSLPPANALVAFEAAARLLNFTAAGRELNVAQPAVTRQIRLLEDNLQVALFQRRNNAVFLTEEGRALYDTVSQALGSIAEHAESLRSTAGTTLTIGSTFAFANMWLAPRLPALRRALEGVSISLFISNEYGEYDRMGVDCSIRFGDGSWPGRQAELLFAEDVMPLAAPKLAAQLDGADPEAWRDILLLDMAGPGDGLSWATWDNWLASMGQRMPIACERRWYENYLYIVDAALRGEGIALGFGSLTDRYVSDGRLVPVGETLSRDPLGYYLVYSSSGFTSPKTQTVLRSLVRLETDT